MKNILLEVCCGSADDVIEAYKAGADRVELNSNLFHGGLTPTVGSLLVAKRETDISVMTMVRPREGGFCYTETEFRVCLADAQLLLEHGADGLVFGFLTADGRIDPERTRQIAEIAQKAGKETVFHRAIDVVPDWREAVDLLADLGITRILTSGQAPDVSDATDTIREMLDYAGDRIQILPGAGITMRNIRRVAEETGAGQLHVAVHRSFMDTSTVNNRSIYYGGCLYPPEDRYQMIDGTAVAAMKKMERR
ncbi:MAG: copper homeostasis protein CutC [Oscillospiraceae bacterium]|nr:copper homeostasis protein CutC [Oscillospiraceae bacterium]